MVIGEPGAEVEGLIGETQGESKGFPARTHRNFGEGGGADSVAGPEESF